jgi:hypothetical protein
MGDRGGVVKDVQQNARPPEKAKISIFKFETPCVVTSLTLEQEQEQAGRPFSLQRSIFV